MRSELLVFKQCLYARRTESLKLKEKVKIGLFGLLKEIMLKLGLQ